MRVIIDAMTRDWPIAATSSATRVLSIWMAAKAPWYRRVTPTSIEVALDTFRRVREEAGFPRSGFGTPGIGPGIGCSARCDAARGTRLLFWAADADGGAPAGAHHAAPGPRAFRVEGETCWKRSACAAMR